MFFLALINKFLKKYFIPGVSQKMNDIRRYPSLSGIVVSGGCATTFVRLTLSCRSAFSYIIFLPNTSL